MSTVFESPSGLVSEVVYQTLPPWVTPWWGVGVTRLTYGRIPSVVSVLKPTYLYLLHEHRRSLTKSDLTKIATPPPQVPTPTGVGLSFLQTLNLDISKTFEDKIRVEYTMTNRRGRLAKVLLVRITKNGLVRLGYGGSGGRSPLV